MSSKNTTKPFGLAFLTEVPATELAKINGGRHQKKPSGPIFTTMHVSLPQPAFPSGDNG